MTIRKKYIFLVFVFIICSVLIIVFNSCAAQHIGDDKFNKIIDSYDREVNIPKKVEKVATIGSATRLVVYAGSVDKLVAITEMDRPNVLRPYTIAYEEKFKDLPTTNNGNQLNNTTIDEEKLLEVDPDVIISTRSGEECEKLENKLKIPVVGVYAQDDLLDDKFSNAIQLVGSATNNTEHANVLIGYLRGVYNDLYDTPKTASPKIYRGAINYRGSKDLTGTYSHYGVYDTISAINVADNPDIKGAYDTTLEQILAWNPEYIFMDYSNKGKVAEQIAQNPQVFSQLQAFKNNNVYFCAPFNSNGTNVEYAICESYQTAKIIYPSSYAHINLDEKFTEVINTLLGKNIYPELKARGVYFGPAQF